MYTWGYLKNATLAKLDLTEEEAGFQDLIKTFPFYANEAITQICSSIKPKHTFAEIVALDWRYKKGELVSITEDANSYIITYNVSNVNMISGAIQTTTLTDTIPKEDGVIYCKVNEKVTMPKDFIAFADDVNERIYDAVTYSCNDEDFRYLGYNQVVLKKPGTYFISYKARWIDFSALQLDENEQLNVPMDILDCIPSYIASQCFKIDDQYKSQVFRNEYEMFLARIDDTDYKNTKTFTIGGDW